MQNSAGTSRARGLGNFYYGRLIRGLLLPEDRQAAGTHLPELLAPVGRRAAEMVEYIFATSGAYPHPSCRASLCKERLTMRGCFRVSQAMEKVEGKAWVNRWLDRRGIEAFAESIGLTCVLPNVSASTCHVLHDSMHLETHGFLPCTWFAFRPPCRNELFHRLSSFALGAEAFARAAEAVGHLRCAPIYACMSAVFSRYHSNRESVAEIFPGGPVALAQRRSSWGRPRRRSGERGRCAFEPGRERDRWSGRAGRP